MDISLKASSLLSEYSTDLILNDKLWQRVKYVHDHTDATKLSPEDATLLNNTYEFLSETELYCKVPTVTVTKRYALN